MSAYLLFFDAAVPPANLPITDGVLIYAGGDTPHPWTVADIARQTARYRLPVWVRSNPTAANPATDAANMILWLKSHGAPVGTVTVLDLETAEDPAFVNTYVGILHGSGYLVLCYGSSSTLPHNPIADGYFPAIPGAKSIPAGDVGVQFQEDADNGAYDLDWFLPTVSFWDTQPVVVVPPLTPNESEIQVNIVDPTSKGTWIVDPADGHVETPTIGGVTAPYLGGLNNPHPDLDDWQQVGTIAGITTFTDASGVGYAIIVRHFTAIEPGGAWYSVYTFSRSGVLA